MTCFDEEPERQPDKQDWDDRKSTKHSSDCLANAGDDEPIFVLRAQDITAPSVVKKWIEINTLHLGPTHPKILAAIATREAMEIWHYRKLPD